MQKLNLDDLSGVPWLEVSLGGQIIAACPLSIGDGVKLDISVPAIKKPNQPVKSNAVNASRNLGAVTAGSSLPRRV